MTVLLQPGAAGALEVRFQPSAQVEGRMLTLGEIASLSPASAMQKHADTELFQAPPEGKMRKYSVSSLKAYILDALPEEADITWSGAESVAVRRSGRLIKGKEVAEIVQRYLQRKAEELPVEGLAFEPADFPAPVTVPRGALEQEVIPSNDRIIGSRYFTVRFRVNGDLAENVTIRGELKATAPVVVASRNLDRSQVLDKKDIDIERRDITDSREPLINSSKAVGMRLKRSVRSGEIIERSEIDRPVLVQRGEVVTMEASKGRLLLTAKGVARSRGKKGETIKVRNTSSQRDVFCKVVGSGRVRVEF